MKFIRKKRKIIRATTAIDGASTKPFWGKKRKKDYRLNAGKGGFTTNALIPEGVFKRELKECEEGVLNA